MTDDERLKLYHQLFPLLKATVGQLLQARVYQDGNQYVLVHDNADGTTRHIAVDFISQVWYVRPLPQVYPYMFQLDQEATDKFYQELLNMLTAQPLIVNNINQNGTPINLKPFDQSDWWAWAGAEKPADSEPLIDYDVKVLGFPDDLNIATVIVDATGIEVYVCSEESLNQTETWYENATPWPDNKAIVAQMSQPITPQMLRKFKFVKVN